jgi:hypothetical protein
MRGGHGKLTAVIQNYPLTLLCYDADLLSEVAWDEMRYGRTVANWEGYDRDRFEGTIQKFTWRV